MATEVGMVLRGESRTYRFLRVRPMFLAGATLLFDAVADLAITSSSTAITAPASTT